MMNAAKEVEIFVEKATSVSLLRDPDTIWNPSAQSLWKLSKPVASEDPRVVHKLGAGIRDCVPEEKEGVAVCAAAMLVAPRRLSSQILETFVDLCGDYLPLLTIVIALRKSPERMLFEALAGENLGDSWPLLMERVRTGPTVARRESAVLLSKENSPHLLDAIRARLNAKRSDELGTAKSDEKQALFRVLEGFASAEKTEMVQKFIDVKSDAIAHSARRVLTSAVWELNAEVPDLDALDERSPQCPNGIILGRKTGGELTPSAIDFIYGRLVDLHERVTDPRLDQIWDDLEIDGTKFVKHFAAQPFALARLGGELGTEALAKALKGETVAARRERIARARALVENQSGTSAVYVSAFSGPKKQRTAARLSLLKAEDTFWTEPDWPEKAAELRTKHAARLGLAVPPIPGVTYQIENQFYVAHGTPLQMHGPEVISAPPTAVPAGPMAKAEITENKKTYKVLGLKPLLRAAPASGTLPVERDAMIHALKSMVRSVEFESGKRVFNTLRRRGYFLGPLFEQLRETMGVQREFYYDLGPRTRITLDFEGIMVTFDQWMKADDYDIETRLDGIWVETDGVKGGIEDLPTPALWFLLWDLSVARFGKVPTGTLEPPPSTPTAKALDIMARSSLSQEPIDESFELHYDFDDRYRKGGPLKTKALKKFRDAGIEMHDETAAFVKKYGVPTFGQLYLKHAHENEKATTVEAYLGLSVLSTEHGQLWVQRFYDDPDWYLPVGETFEDVVILNGSGLFEYEDRKARVKTLHPILYDAVKDCISRILAKMEDQDFVASLPNGIAFQESVVGRFVVTPRQFGIKVAQKKFGFDWNDVPFVFESGKPLDFSALNDDLDYTEKLMDYGRGIAMKLLSATRKVAYHDHRIYRFFPLETEERVAELMPKEDFSTLRPYQPITAYRPVNIKQSTKLLVGIDKKLKKRARR